MLVVNDKNQVESRTVVAPQAIGDRWLITEGLKNGDRVIISGLQKFALALPSWLFLIPPRLQPVKE